MGLMLGAFLSQGTQKNILVFIGCSDFPWNKASSELGVHPWLWKPQYGLMLLMFISHYSPLHVGSMVDPCESHVFLLKSSEAWPKDVVLWHMEHVPSVRR
jgi:hypothetical protein